MKPEFIFFAAAYFAIVLLAGLAFSRRMKNLDDFFLASRKLPAGLIYLSLTASWFGATSILVSTDEALRTGVSAFWIVGLPAVATVLILAIFLSGPLHRLPVMTIPDLVELRYGRTVRHLASLLIIWYLVMLAASQMVALGQFLKTFLGLSYGVSLGLGTAVVLIYSMTGGLRSVVFTDVVQFLLLVGGTVGLAVWLAVREPWPEISRIVAGREGYFDFFHGFKENALIAFSFTLAWTISPIAIQRILAGRDIRAARKGLSATAGTLFLLYGCVVAIGILSLPLFPGRTLSGPLVSEIIAAKAGPWLGGFLFVAVLAAVLSTMDTAINTGALSLTNDAYFQLFPASRLGAVPAGRLATLAVGISALLIATRFQNILKTIGLSSEIMAEGFFVPGIAMIFMKKRVPLAGLLSLCLGGGFSILSFLGSLAILPVGLPVWPYSIPWGLSLGIFGFCAGLVLEKIRGRGSKAP
jgi:SSS family solute:Na+ symporter